MKVIYHSKIYAAQSALYHAYIGEMHKHYLLQLI